MDQAQQQWLTKLGVATNKHIAFEVKDNAKRGALRSVATQIESAKNSIREATTFAITQKGELTYSMTETSEQLDELSMREAEDRLNAEEKERIELKRQELAAAAENLRNKLREAGFNEMEINETITEELYFPLVREKLMPEDLVPDQYSKTQQMLDATNQLYEDALKDEPEEEEPSGFDKAKKGIGYAAKIGKGIADIVGTQGLADQAKMANDIISLSELALTTGVTAAEAISKDELRGSLSDIVDNIGSILTTAIAFDPNLKGVARTVGTVYKAATKTAMVAKLLSDSPPDIEGALVSFADGFNAAFAAGSKKAGESDQAKLKASAQIVAAAFKAAAKIPAIKKAIENRDFTALINNLTEVGKEAVSTGFNAKATLEESGKTEEEKKKIQEAKDALLKKINDGITTGNLAIATGVAVYSAAVQGEINQAVVEAIDGIGKSLQTALGAFAPPSIAKTVGNAYTYSTSSTLVAMYLIKGQPGKAIAALGEGFQSAMELCNPDSDDKTFIKVGKSMKILFASAVTAADVKAAIDTGDYAKAGELFAAGGKNALSGFQNLDSETPSEGGDEEEEDLEADDWDTDEEAFEKEDKKQAKEDEASEELAKKEDSLEGRATKAGKAIASSASALKALLLDERSQKKMQDKLDEKRKADVEDEVKREQADYERMLTLVDEGGEAAADARSVETLIKQMQRDRMIMDLALKVAGGGLDVAAKFVPGLAVGSAAVKMAASLTAAANRAVALNKWLDNQKDGKTAASVYSSSIQNFVQNQKEQFSYYAIKAALQLAQLIGASLTASGLGAVVGEPLNKAAALAETAADMAKEFYDEAQLQRAWATTKAAFADKKNRKLGLLARKQNPTLAKYSIAWGAVAKKDAIAKKAMNSCGLNAATLAQKDTNVEIVVKYLETMFPDDRVIRKALPKTAEWQPDDVTLTVKCWVTAKLGGEKHANLAKADSGAIEGSLVAFAEFEVSASKAQKEQKLTAKLLDDYEAERKRLNGAFGAYTPLLKDGKPHTDMQDVVDRFVALTEVAKATIVEMRSDLLPKAPPSSGGESVPPPPPSPPPLTRR